MPRRSFLASVPAILLLGISTRLVPAGETAPTPDPRRFFEAQVRPVLADHCFKCHGPDKQKAGLRLDSRAAMIAGGDAGPAVVPGNPRESPLVAAIRHEGDGPKMPPSKKLPDRAIADLARWVEMGAPWPGGDEPVAASPRKGEYQITDKDRAHWAFRPIVRPPVPEVPNHSGSANPIDAFLLARLDARGLKPNPPAARHELIRRVFYDLTGLPPTPGQVDSFVNDPSPTAYEELVDRLLDSPRYGEAWGRHWLDLVRFAETNSYERDGRKPNAWRYRDYVIRSFNQDKPYDRFVREQLAGDELPDGGVEGLIATGYYRLGIWDDEPADRDQARYDGLDDLVGTTGQVFLGLTVDCARCHDHKLDPIPQKDYYRLLAFFQNINGGPLDETPIFESPGRRESYEIGVRDLERRRQEARAALASIEQEFLAKEGLDAAEGDRPPDLDELRYRYYRDTWDVLPDFSSIKPETTGDLPRNRFDLRPRTRDDAFGFVFEGVLIVPRAGSYTFFLDSDDGSRLTVAGRTILTYDGIHGEGEERKVEVDLPEGRLPIRLDYFQRYAGFGLSVAWSGPGFGRRSLSASTRERQPGDLVTRIRDRGRRVLGAERFEAYQSVRRRVEALKKERVPGDAALCVSEAGPEAPETFVRLRGNPHAKGDRVEPGFLQVLGAAAPTIPTPPPGARTTGRRRALADWIASPENPLAARVMANRIWQYHFGRGIVRSPSNFGLQGDRPTHPELLDWLASEFLRQGWRLKPLHRLIVTSLAYRMSSKADKAALAADPSNDLFWRFDMRRLTAEEIRDTILAVGGTLNPTMYGPGIYPRIPKEVMAGQSMPGAGWGTSTPEEEARRSIYIHAKRSLLTPILESFDVAETDRSTPVRFATTQPTQALAMMNGAFLNAQAATLADRLRREAGDDPARQVALALRLATCRSPRDSEIRRGLDLIDALRARDGADADAALRAFCLAVLNLDELIYVD